MAFCRNCGTRLYEGSKFCPNCGAAVILDNPTVSKPEPVHEEPVREEPLHEEPIHEQPVSSEPTAKKEFVYGTNGLAIAGFICAFLFPFVGLVLSIVANKNAKSGKYEKPMQGFATWGIIVSIILLALRLIFGVVCGFVLFPAILKGLSHLAESIAAAVI